MLGGAGHWYELTDVSVTFDIFRLKRVAIVVPGVAVDRFHPLRHRREKAPQPFRLTTINPIFRLLDGAAQTSLRPERCPVAVIVTPWRFVIGVCPHAAELELWVGH